MHKFVGVLDNPQAKSRYFCYRYFMNSDRMNYAFYSEFQRINLWFKKYQHVFNGTWLWSAKDSSYLLIMQENWKNILQEIW